MAFEVKKISPLDLQPRKAIGVSIPFSGTAVFNSTYQTKDATRANLINYLLTGLGERYLNPSFGLGLRRLLFENINDDTITEVRYLVEEGIKTYFPRVIITSLTITPTPNTNSIYLELRYSIRDTGLQDEVTINFQQ